VHKVQEAGNKNGEIVPNDKEKRVRWIQIDELLLNEFKLMEF